MNRDGHLTVDPSQAILIISISPTFRDSQAFLVLRTQSLIEHARLTHADTQISWDEWGKGAVVMEHPNDSGSFITSIHGTRVLVIRCDTDGGPGGGCRIHTLDFSRRGSAALPLLDEG